MLLRDGPDVPVVTFRSSCARPALYQVHELDAAVMVVDVSGFSGMCERFAQGVIPDGGWRHRITVSPCFSTDLPRSSMTPNVISYSLVRRRVQCSHWLIPKFRPHGHVWCRTRLASVKRFQ